MRLLRQHFGPPLLLGLVAAAVGSVQLARASFWLDEAFSVNLAARPWPGFLQEITHHEGNQAAYFVLLKLWPFPHTELGARSLSVLCTSGTAVTLYFLGVRLVDRWVGVAAALMVSTTPFALQATQEARGYALLMLASVGCMLALVRAVQQGRGWLWWALTAGLLPYVHLYGALVVVGQLPWALRAAPRAKVLSAIAGAGVLAAPMALWAQTHQHSRQLFFLKAPGLEAIGGALAVLAARSAPLLLLLVAATALGLGFLARRPTLALLVVPWLVLTPLVVVVGSHLGTPAYQPRYLAGIAPALALLFALGVRSLGALPLRNAALVSLIGLSAVALRGHLGPLLQEDWRSAAGYLQTQWRTGDTLVGQPCFERIGLYPYLPGLPPAALDQSCGGSAGREWVVSRNPQEAPAGHRLASSRRFDRIVVNLYVAT